MRNKKNKEKKKFSLILYEEIHTKLFFILLMKISLESNGKISLSPVFHAAFRYAASAINQSQLVSGVIQKWREIQNLNSQ